MRHAHSWPDVLRFSDRDSGEIGLGENLESVAAFTFCGKPTNAPFQFAKACQPVEKPALKIAPRLWVGRRHHWVLLVIERGRYQSGVANTRWQSIIFARSCQNFSSRPTAAR